MKLEEIQKIITEKWPNEYKDRTLKVTMEDIEKLPNFLRIELENFLQTGKYPELEVEGYNFKKLIEEFSLHPIGAFLMLNWLQEKPEEAKKALQRGWDRIVPIEK